MPSLTGTRGSGRRRSGRARYLANPAVYRVRSCLLAVAGHPGTSSREVAARIGVEHLSQVSHLLTRLAARGVLVKRGHGTGRSNAWTATPKDSGSR